MNISSPFTRELVQAVSDWQRKATDRKKRYKKAMELRAQCSRLPAEFRETRLTCLRQMALDKASVWNLLGEQTLDEQVSSWTQDMEMAKTLLGGVSPADTGFTEVIFTLYPRPEQVVVNLKKLLDDQRFIAAVQDHRTSIDYFEVGLGRYGNSQSEIVLDVGKLSERDIWTLGGRSSSFDELVYRAFMAVYGRHPGTQQEFDAFREGVHEMESQAGARWLSPESAINVLNRIRPKADALREIEHRRQALIAASRQQIDSLHT